MDKKHINIDCSYVITYSELYSKEPLTEKSIAKKIAQLNIKQTLNILLKFTSVIDSYLRGDTAGIAEYHIIKFQYRMLLFFQGADLKHYDNGLLTCPQGLLTAFKWLIAYGNNKAEDNISSEILYGDIYNVLSLVIIIADYLPKDEVEHNKIEFCNAAQYFGAQKVIKYELARAYNIFVENQIELPGYISDAFVGKYGISIEEYLANSFNFLNYAFIHDNFWNHQPGYPISNFDAKSLKDSYYKYIQMMSLNFEDGKKKAKSSLHKKWDFSWFLLYPLAIIDEYACPFNYFTFSYVWFEGLYWRIRFCFDRKDTKFFDDFGKPFESYIQSICKKSISLKNEYLFIDEHEYTITKGRKPRSSDGYILKGDNLLIIECKAKAPSAETVSGYNINAINDEIIDLIVAPVHQVDKRYMEMMQFDQEFISLTKEVKNIFVIVVSLEKIQPLPYTYGYADSYLRESGKIINVDGKDEESEIRTDKINCYYNLNAYEFEKICALIENRIDIFAELYEYSIQPICPFENFINSRGYQELRSSVVEEYMANGINAIYKRTFGDEVHTR